MMMSGLEKSSCGTGGHSNSSSSDGGNNNNNNNDSNATSKMDGEEEKPEEVLSLLDDDDDDQLALVAAAVASSSSSFSPPSSSPFFTSPPSVSIASGNMNASLGNGNHSGFQDYGDSILSQIGGNQQHVSNHHQIHHSHHHLNINQQHHHQQQQQQQQPLQQQQSPLLQVSPISSSSLSTSPYPVLPPAYPSNIAMTSSQALGYGSFTDSLSATSTPSSSATTMRMDRTAAAGSIAAGTNADDCFGHFLAGTDIPASSLENRMKIERDFDNIFEACKNSLGPSPGDCPDISASYANSNSTTNCSTYNASAISNLAGSCSSGGNKNFYRSASDVSNTAINNSSSSNNAMSMYSNMKNRIMSGGSTMSSSNNSSADNMNTVNSAYATASSAFHHSSGSTSTTTATTTAGTTNYSSNNNSNSSSSNAGGGNNNNLTMSAARQRRASEYGYAQALLSQAPKIAAGISGGASGSASDLDGASVLRLAHAFVTLQQGLQSCEASNNPRMWWPGTVDGGSIAVAAQEALSCFMLILTSRLNVVYVSDVVEKLLGHGQLNLIGHSIRTLVHPEEMSVLAAQFPNLSVSDGEASLERSFYTRMLNGARSNPQRQVFELVHVIGHLQPVTLADSSPEKEMWLMCACRVIQPRVEKEGTGQPYTEWVSHTTLDGKYIYQDPRASQVIGFLPKEVIDRSLYCYIHQEDIEHVAFAHNQTLLTGSWSCTYRMYTHAQDLVYVHTNTKLARDKDDHKPKFLLSFNNLLSESEGREQVIRCHQELMKVKGGPHIKYSMSDIEQTLRKLESEPPTANIMPALVAQKGNMKSSRLTNSYASDGTDILNVYLRPMLTVEKFPKLSRQYSQQGSGHWADNSVNDFNLQGMGMSQQQQQHQHQQLHIQQQQNQQQQRQYQNQQHMMGNIPQLSPMCRSMRANSTSSVNAYGNNMGFDMQSPTSNPQQQHLYNRQQHQQHQNASYNSPGSGLHLDSPMGMSASSTPGASGSYMDLLFDNSGPPSVSSDSAFDPDTMLMSPSMMLASSPGRTRGRGRARGRPRGSGRGLGRGVGGRGSRGPRGGRGRGSRGRRGTGATTSMTQLSQIRDVMGTMKKRGDSSGLIGYVPRARRARGRRGAAGTSVSAEMLRARSVSPRGTMSPMGSPGEYHYGDQGTGMGRGQHQNHQQMPGMSSSSAMSRSQISPVAGAAGMGLQNQDFHHGISSADGYGLSPMSSASGTQQQVGRGTNIHVAGLQRMHSDDSLMFQKMSSMDGQDFLDPTSNFDVQQTPNMELISPPHPWGSGQGQGMMMADPGASKSSSMLNQHQGMAMPVKPTGRGRGERRGRGSRGKRGRPQIIRSHTIDEASLPAYGQTGNFYGNKDFHMRSLGRAGGEDRGTENSSYGNSPYQVPERMTNRNYSKKNNAHAHLREDSINSSGSMGGMRNNPGMSPEDLQRMQSFQNQQLQQQQFKPSGTNHSGMRGMHRGVTGLERGSSFGGMERGGIAGGGGQSMDTDTENSILGNLLKGRSSSTSSTGSTKSPNLSLSMSNSNSGLPVGPVSMGGSSGTFINMGRMNSSGRISGAGISPSHSLPDVGGKGGGRPASGKSPASMSAMSFDKGGRSPAHSFISDAASPASVFSPDSGLPANSFSCKDEPQLLSPAGDLGSMSSLNPLCYNSPHDDFLSAVTGQGPPEQKSVAAVQMFSNQLHKKHQGMRDSLNSQDRMLQQYEAQLLQVVRDEGNAESAYRIQARLDALRSSKAKQEKELKAVQAELEAQIRQHQFQQQQLDHKQQQHPNQQNDPSSHPQQQQPEQQQQQQQQQQQHTDLQRQPLSAPLNSTSTASNNRRMAIVPPIKRQAPEGHSNSFHPQAGQEDPKTPLKSGASTGHCVTADSGLKKLRSSMSPVGSLCDSGSLNKPGSKMGRPRQMSQQGQMVEVGVVGGPVGGGEGGGGPNAASPYSLHHHHHHHHHYHHHPPLPSHHQQPSMDFSGHVKGTSSITPNMMGASCSPPLPPPAYGSIAGNFESLGGVGTTMYPAPFSTGHSHAQSSSGLSVSVSSAISPSLASPAVCCETSPVSVDEPPSCASDTSSGYHSLSHVGMQDLSGPISSSSTSSSSGLGNSCPPPPGSINSIKIGTVGLPSSSSSSNPSQCLDITMVGNNAPIPSRPVSSFSSTFTNIVNSSISPVSSASSSGLSVSSRNKTSALSTPSPIAGAGDGIASISPDLIASLSHVSGGSTDF